MKCQLSYCRDWCQKSLQQDRGVAVESRASSYTWTLVADGVNNRTPELYMTLQVGAVTHIALGPWVFMLCLCTKTNRLYSSLCLLVVSLSKICKSPHLRDVQLASYFIANAKSIDITQNNVVLVAELSDFVKHTTNKCKENYGMTQC